MSYWQIAGGIIVAIVSFGAGWLAATEKVRIEVYKARLDVYRGMCRKAARVLQHSLSFENKGMDAAQTIRARVAVLDASLELFEEIMAGGALVSSSVMKHAVKMYGALAEGEYKKAWDDYLVLAGVMASDLGLRESFTITEGLMNPLKRFLGRQNGA